MEGDKKNNNNNNNNNKQTLGRRKIEIKRIKKKEDRVTTFFKRRSGIYKKAAEISALCGAEVAFGAFSPAGNPFSFATSSIDSIAYRFLSRHVGLAPEAAGARQLEGLKERYNDLDGKLTAERELSKALGSGGGEAAEEMIMGWWEAPIEELSIDELRKMDESMKKLRQKLLEYINGGKPN